MIVCKIDQKARHYVLLSFLLLFGKEEALFLGDSSQTENMRPFSLAPSASVLELSSLLGKDFASLQASGLEKPWTVCPTSWQSGPADMESRLWPVRGLWGGISPQTQ